LDTNGKLLLEKADKIIGNMETLTISVIENDDEGDEQYRIVKKFLKVKGDRQPLMIYRLLGDVSYIGDDSKYHNPMHNEKNRDRWYKLPGIIATRTLHNPMGSFKYEKKITVPEIGICLDLLNHLVIDKDGDVFTCVRFNPKKYNLLGNVRDKSLYSMWNGPQRQSLIQEHIKGNRKCSKLCEKCEFYGCPIG
jgi:radical SAM protein with 4Fe4S-binding SPASM domain